MRETVECHARLAALLRAPTVFRLLNDGGRSVGPQQFGVCEHGGGEGDPSSVDRDLSVALATIQRASPGGVTPLVGHINEIRDNVRALEPQLRRDGTKVATVLVGFDGTHYEGEITKGLKEVIGVYSAIFQERADINAALHTHSPYLTAHAIAHKSFEISYWSVAKRAGVETIPLGDWAPRYAPEPIVKSLREHPAAPAVLLRNRGLFTWGSKGLIEVAKLLNSLEEAAEIGVYAKLLGGAQSLPQGALDSFLAQRKG